MIERRHRFHGYNTLQKLYKRSKLIKSPVIGLRYSKRNNNRPYRIAVSVGRKVNKSAVKRNRIRRRIFEAIRQNITIPDSYDLAFYIYNDSVETMPNKELVKLLENLINKIEP